jgi:cobalt-zinc-cadmium efflux system protein
MTHNHTREPVNEKNIIISIFLNFIITVTEVAGGLMSGSLALVSDALHNFSDCVSLIISYSALKMSARKKTLQLTFGYKRAEILAALFNSSVLLIVIFFLFREAYARLRHPAAINGFLMIAVALIGLLANFVAVLLLRRDSRKNLNIKSAYLHLLTDTVSSIGVVLGGIAVLVFKAYWVDPILTVLIGLYVLRESYAIIIQAAKILMQATPDNVDILNIQRALEELPEVENLHHVHVWQVTENETHFEGHVDVCEDLNISRITELNQKIEKILRERFGIEHATIQVEYGSCSDKKIIREC